MGFSLRQFETESKFSRELRLEALGRAIPTADIEAVLAAAGKRVHRERKLNMVVVILILIGMNLFAHLSIGHVMRKLAQGLRFVWPDSNYDLPGANAFSYRRYQLGAKPLVTLLHQVCRPLATPETPGAFLFGLRLMAIDGTIEDVPDTPANVAVFGRHISGRGQSAFPQVQCVYLVECGTHAILDFGVWPCHTSERVGGFRMLRKLTDGMLVMWDRGLHDFEMLLRARQRGAHVLSRLPAHVKPHCMRILPDGSYLAYLYPSSQHRRKQGEHLLVRLITYTLTDPLAPGYAEVHRLVTTILDHTQAPAIDMACAYHERWEIELVIDELDTHQRLAAGTLRSLKPVGVVQELYALAIAHYAVRTLMYEAACQADLDPDRLSFVHALRVIQDAIPEFQMIPRYQHKRLYARLLTDIIDELLPERRPRSNPRVVKRKMSKFHLKRSQHYAWPQPSMPFRQSVAVI